MFTCPAGNGSAPSPACEVQELRRTLEGLAQSEMARQHWATTREAAASGASPESPHHREQQLLLAGNARSATCMHACAQGRLQACTLATRCRRGRLGRASGAAAAAAGSPGQQLRALGSLVALPDQPAQPAADGGPAAGQRYRVGHPRVHCQVRMRSGRCMQLVEVQMRAQGGAWRATASSHCPPARPTVHTTPQPCC